MARTSTFLGTALLLLVLGATPGSAAQRCRVGITGEYLTGYNGILARWGIPHEVILDNQLSDAAFLHRYDIILTSELPDSVRVRSMQALMDYVREGGILVLDGPSAPPDTVVAGPRGRMRETPGITVSGASPLAALLGGEKTFPDTRHGCFLDPTGDPQVTLLASYSGTARFLGRRGGFGGGQAQEGELSAGTPAIWAKPLGKGVLVYCGPGLAYTISLEGSDLLPLAEALIRYLGKEGVEPQLVPEGLHFARKENALTLHVADPGPVVEEKPAAGPAARPKPPVPASALPAGAQGIEGGSDAADFNLSGTYLPAKGRGDLFLNYWNARYYVSVSFQRSQARLVCTAGGKSVAHAALTFPAASPVPFVLKERGDSLLLTAGGHTATFRAPHLWEGKAASRGTALSALRFQPVEPVYFSDDFMRTAAEQGAWEIAAGEWTSAPVGVPDLGANPFTYTGKASGAGVALAGYRFWDEYRYQAAVKPTSSSGYAGLSFYAEDARRYFALRARVQDNPGSPKEGIQLIRVADGKERVLTSAPGCLVTGQWYTLAVRVHGGTVSAAIDGRAVLKAEDPELVEGKVGLYIQDATAKFDDVDVSPASTPASAMVLLDAPAPKYAGSIDLDTWAAPCTQWDADAARPGLFWRRGDFYGDFHLAFRLLPPDKSTGTLVAAGGSGAAAKGVSDVRPVHASLAGRGARMMLLLNGPEAGYEDGYAFSLRPVGSAYEVAMLRKGVVVARARAEAGVEPVMVLQRAGKHLQGWLDGRLLLDYCDARPLPGQMRLGFLAEGYRPRMSGLRLSAAQVLNYTFERAPADWWIGRGAWDVTNRWSCSPEWSWFGGTSSAVAAIWQKRRLSGDVTLDFYVAGKMLDHGSGQSYEMQHDFNAVLCGDGRDVMTGYTFVVAEGVQRANARLLRNGQVVATNEDLRFMAQSHNRWFNIQARKEGAEVSLWVEGHRLLRWVDPQPLESGYAGIWTRDNGVMIPRVTLFTQRVAGPLLPSL